MESHSAFFIYFSFLNVNVLTSLFGFVFVVFFLENTKRYTQVATL